jgi:hypothetical protein
MMSKQLIRGTGLAIGASLLSMGQVLASGFTIDSFNNQFTSPSNSQVPLPITTRPCNNLTANPLILRTGTCFPTNFPNGDPNPATIFDPSGLPSDQVIGGSRDMEMFSVQNANSLTTSGQSRIFPTTTTGSGGFWQVSSSNGSRVSSSMIWDNIDPLLGPTESNSGQFENRLNRGAIAFKTLQVIPGSTNPDFQNVFTITIGDGTNFASVSRNGVGSNEFVFVSFEEFSLANLDLDLNAVNYVELNIVTGGGNSSTVRVDFVQGFEIPEPSLVLACVTVFGVGFLSLKGKQTKAEEN